MAAISGCGNYSASKPKMGVTRAFPRSIVGDISTRGNYKFQQLKQNTGLYIFSYQITAKQGVKGLATEPFTRDGLRIWEHTFKWNKADTISKVETIPIRYEFTSIPGFQALNWDERTKGKVRIRYRKRQVVYGGRYVVDFSGEYPLVTVEQHFEEDCLAFQKYMDDSIDGISIISDPMELPEDYGEWKD